MTYGVGLLCFPVDDAAGDVLADALQMAEGGVLVAHDKPVAGLAGCGGACGERGEAGLDDGKDQRQPLPDPQPLLKQRTF